MNILITGGPVYGKLDDVKYITNKFKGGLISKLADQLQSIAGEQTQITYLTSKGSKIPSSNSINIVYHDGFFEYQKKVLEFAPQMDAVILGAAVANLIPKEPFTGKFPSHNYRIGETINIPFIIAPRVIEQVKSVAPKVHLFGFKLLSGVKHEDLIDIAYETALKARADAIFANDTMDLMAKYAVTKEFSIIPLTADTYANFIWQAINDQYYKTETVKIVVKVKESTKECFEKYKTMYSDKFVKLYGGQYRFGTIAVRMDDNMFYTTIRGKEDFSESTVVFYVNQRTRSVYIPEGFKKATLNAPLLANLFKSNPEIAVIVHFHDNSDDSLQTLSYAFPGTVRDSVRHISSSFNINYHGVFLLYNEMGELIR